MNIEQISNILYKYQNPTTSESMKTNIRPYEISFIYGNVILITMLIEIVSVALMPYMKMLFFYLFKLVKKGRTNVIRRILKYRIPPIFNLETRFSGMFVILFMALLYSCTIPLAIPCCLLSFFLIYWVDKSIFIIYSQKPYHASPKFMNLICFLLPLASLVSIGYTILTYGDLTSFSQANHLFTSNDNLEVIQFLFISELDLYFINIGNSKKF